MNNDNYEVRFLELAVCPGMESLRRECPTYIQGETYDKICSRCWGRGWLPLLEAERMGGLVGAAINRLLCLEMEPGRVAIYKLDVLGRQPRDFLSIKYRDSLEEALIEALLSILVVDVTALLQEIISNEFSVKLNIASSTKGFFDAAKEEPVIISMSRTMKESVKAQEEVFNMIYDLSRLEVDERYENPNDVALAVLLWLTLHAVPDNAQAVAELVYRIPQCWYAKKLALEILALER